MAWWAKVRWSGAAWKDSWVRVEWLDARTRRETRQRIEREQRRQREGGRWKRAVAVGEARRRVVQATAEGDSEAEEEAEAGWKRSCR